ncbi:MAG TPA: hypothetical protein VEJ63_11645 [Planctomycetota bacterium]|nr:hypothetical protein [Planctomycetota bacterium]
MELRLCAVLVSLLPLMAPCADDVVVSEESVRAQILLLAAEDFESRESATSKLIAFGEAAWPSVRAAFNGGDPEREERLQRVAREIAVLPEELRCAADYSLEKLFDTVDARRRAEGLEELRQMGPAGIRLARRHLVGAEARLVIEGRCDRKVVLLGDPVRVTWRAKNTGSSALWLSNTGQLGIRSTGWRHFSGSNGGGTITHHCGSGRPTPALARSFALPPGEELERTHVRWPVRPGLFRMTARMVPASMASVPIGDDAAEMNAKWTPEQELLDNTVEVMVLPNFHRHGSADMTLELKARLAQGDEEKLKIDVELHNRTAEPVVLVPKHTSYGWYGWLDKDRVPVAHGGWQEPGVASDKESQPVPMVLAPKGAFLHGFSVDAPKAPGKYALLLGYNPTPPDDAKGVEFYDGQLYMLIEDAAEVK